MSGSAGDFYVLEESVVPQGWQRKLNRPTIERLVCTRIEPRDSEPTCTGTSGPGVGPGIGQVDYEGPADGPLIPTGPYTPKGLREGITVTTEHGALSMDSYVSRWNGMANDGPVVATTVRGHDARAYDTNGPNTPTLTWQEAPGLLVSVSGHYVDASLVAAVAEYITIVDVVRLPIS
jgi:hypothetical protein